MSENGSLLALLKEHFGFDSFLPLQEEIIADSLAGRDVFALLPTGGGKSLCFQLPALARPGLTVVVSPLIALTTTATERVRSDKVRYLKLRDPACHVGSFNRPNLTYRVVPKQGPYSQVLDFVRARPNERGIVYCHSRRSAESLAERLSDDGVKALPYHAGLTPLERTRNQETFARDDVPVICATIAFGMGINKPNVRFVLHNDLPRSVENYYQETGRAGRDGLPSECLLLFSNSEAVKYLRFLDEITDPHEREVTRKKLDEMVWCAESAG